VAVTLVHAPLQIVAEFTETEMVGAQFTWTICCPLHPPVPVHSAIYCVKKGALTVVTAEEAIGTQAESHEVYHVPTQLPKTITPIQVFVQTVSLTYQWEVVVQPVIVNVALFPPPVHDTDVEITGTGKAVTVLHEFAEVPQASVTVTQ
jgi:hypothetical protein